MVWISVFPSNVQPNPARSGRRSFNQMRVCGTQGRGDGANRALFWGRRGIFRQRKLTHTCSAQKFSSGAGNG